LQDLGNHVGLDDLWIGAICHEFVRRFILDGYWFPWPQSSLSMRTFSILCEVIPILHDLNVLYYGATQVQYDNLEERKQYSNQNLNT